MDRKTHGFHKRSDGGGSIRMRKHDSVNSRCEYLIEHPGVRMHGGLIHPVYRYVDNDGGCAMSAPVGTARNQPSHVVAQPFDVVRGVFHVVANVVGVGL